MNTETQTREWLYALVATKLSKGTLLGEKPSLVEIEQWRVSALPQPRADEVLSHVAHDEKCFEQWRDLCEEQRWLEQQQGEPLLQDQPLPKAMPDLVPQREQGKSWLGGVVGRLGLAGLPLWGGAVAAAVLALLVLPAIFRPGDDAIFQTYQQQLALVGEGLGSEFPVVLARSTKAVQKLDVGALNQDKHQFQLGLAAVASRLKTVQDTRWDAWRATLPESVDCENNNTLDCSAEAVRNQALGSWSLLTALACGQSDVDGDFWRQQASALGELTRDPLQRDHFLAARLQKPLPESRESLCIMANGLLGQGG